MRRTTLPVSAVLLALLVSSGCGGTQTTRDRAPDPGGALEVVNLTDTRRAILLDDDSIGSVEAGARARYRFLRTGAHKVTAEAAWPDDGEDVTAQLSLAAGKVTVWELPGSRPLPASLADLVVVNRWPQDLEVFVVEGGARLGGVLTGDTRVFHDLPAGERRLQVVGRDGERLEVSAPLDADTPWTWQVEARLGVVQIVNDTDERVAIDVDGVERALCLARDAVIVDRLPAGPHVLTARGLVTRTARRHNVTIDADRPTRWELTSGRASLVVGNRSGEPVEVVVDGREAVVIAQGESQRFEDIASGTVLATATGTTSANPHRQRFEARPGQEVTWTITGVTGTLRVRNGTERTLIAYVGGIERAEIPAGVEEVVSLGGAPPFEVTAVSRDGSLVFRRDIDPGEALAATWRISTEGGAVHVTNARDEPMEVFIDAAPAGRIAAGEATTFTGIGSGPRLLEAVGLRSGAVLRERLELDGGEVAGWTVRDPRATVVVANLTDEPLLLEGEGAEQKPLIQPAERTLYNLRPGQQVMRLVGTRSGVSWQRGLDLKIGAVIEWTIEPGRGVLEVRNELRESLAIEIDGVSRGALPPGSVMRVDDLTEGQHQLRAVGETTGRVELGERVVTTSGTARWPLTPTPASLVVLNEADEPVSVLIDGRPYGRVEAGARQGIGQLTAGERRVEATGLRTGWRHTTSVRLLDGGSETLVVPAPRGVLVVDNQSGEAQRVLVDGVLQGDVAAGATGTRLSVPAGRRQIVLEGVASGRTTSFRVDLGVSHAVHLLAPLPRSRLVVANHTGAPLRIWVNDREVGAATDGDSLIVDDLKPGAWRLTARHAEGRVTHSERRDVAPGETATWALQAASRGDDGVASEPTKEPDPP